MVNPSAARHLALVVGVLLCFFVYMGYYIKSKREPQAEFAGRNYDMASLDDNAPAARREQSSLMTMAEPPGQSAGGDSVEVAVPSGLPLPIGGITGDRQSVSQPNEQLSLADGLLGGRGDSIAESAGAPSGSIEESAGSAAITGISLDPAAAASVGNAAEPAPAAALLGAPDSGAAVQADMSGGRTGGNSSGAAVPSLPVPDAGVSRSETAPAAANAAASRNNTPPPPPPPAAADADEPEWRQVSDAPDAPAGRNEAFNPPNRLPANLADEGQIRTYVIQPGDTLIRIASRELGSRSLADNIYLMNRDVIWDPDHLTVGTRIKLPPRPDGAVMPQHAGQDGAGSGFVAAAAGSEQRSAAGLPPGTRLYRIKPGDTLSSISLQYYGSSSGWRFLYESNAQVIPNPNQLSVGTQIVIPPYGEKP